MEWTEYGPDECRRMWREYKHKSTPPIKAFLDVNREWVVQVFPVATCDGTPWEGMLRVGINQYHPRDQRPLEIRTSWSKIQAIKDSIFPDRLAIEVFPPTNQIHNVAPMRWLWVLPLGVKLPLGLESDTVG